MVAKRRGGHVHLWPLTRPWAALALALGTALLAYYAYLGIRYLDASQDVTSLTGEARRIASALQVAPPNEEALEMEMESETLGLKALDSAFGREGGNDLIAILSQLAHETPVGLTSIAVGEPKPAPFSTAGFTQQSVTLALNGNADGLLRYLSLVHQAVPAMAVTDLHITFQSGPYEPSSASEDGRGSPAAVTAQLKLLFYLSPKDTLTAAEGQ